MRLKITGLCLALSFLAGCSSAPVNNAITDTASAVVPGSAEDFMASTQDRVFFSFDRFDLTPEAQAVLQKQAAWLQKYPQVSIVVEGHCDERGTREYNIALGERRANTSKHFLVALGVNVDRIEVISYGKERPFSVGSSEEAWSQNRVSRTVVK